MTDSEQLQLLDELRVAAGAAHAAADQADAAYCEAHARDTVPDPVATDGNDSAHDLDACNAILADPLFMDVVVAHALADRADDVYRAALRVADLKQQSPRVLP